MGFYDKIIRSLPSITDPKVHLNFKKRLIWTAVILLLFIILGQITVYGVSRTAQERFQFLEMILGSKMGSLITLGIGPIVTASIILQLLVGSKIIPWNLRTQEGKIKFQGTQKLLTVFFCIFEAVAYVSFGAIQPLSPDPGLMMLIIAQLTFGGVLILLMDEVVSKWGIGSGVSLFIAAGVTAGIFVGALNPCANVGTPGCTLGDPSAGIFPFGHIPQAISYLQIGEVTQTILSLLPLIATITVFFIVVYVQAIKVEIPLAFGSFRGFSRRWPLKFIYTSNIPVILAAALLANMQLLGSMMAGRGITILGTFDENGTSTGGLLHYLLTPHSSAIQVFSITLLIVIFAGGMLAFYLKHRNAGKIVAGSIVLGIVLAAIVSNAFIGLPTGDEMLRLTGHVMFMVIASVVFSIFWVATAGMDARSVAEQIQGLGMQIPGFRRDPRIVESVLNRYIPTLAVLGGIFVGLLAAVADLTGALGTGTGILLTVMIIYNLYEQISMQYVEDMHPAVRKFFGH
ncbi:MAG: preprotein translocase subunit SecY [Candidatus Aenigmarchaeota archaeon]|nr:preprotein translocase subunit SecY [Candidatus Aenigmarchaeota archaeon]